jgi:hypothetical protein
VANTLIVVSWYGIGRRWRWALLLGAAGSVLWAAVGVSRSMWDLAVIEVVLAAMGLRAWWLWGTE